MKISRGYQGMFLRASPAQARPIPALSPLSPETLERTDVVCAGAAVTPQTGFPHVLPQKESRRHWERGVSSTLPGSPCPSLSVPSTLLAVVSSAVFPDPVQP